MALIIKKTTTKIIIGIAGTGASGNGNWRQDTLFLDL